MNSIEDAMNQVSGQVPTISQLRQEVASRFAGVPQNAALADALLAQAEDALAKLAGLGEVFHLRRGDAAERHEEWPLMLYRQHPDNGRLESQVVHGDAEQKEAQKAGWHRDANRLVAPAPVIARPVSVKK